MTDITVGTLTREATKSARNTAHKSFLRRLFEALIEARTRQAAVLLEDYRRNGPSIW
jgi:hypothetical protein